MNKMQIKSLIRQVLVIAGVGCLKMINLFDN